MKNLEKSSLGLCCCWVGLCEIFEVEKSWLTEVNEKGKMKEM